MFTRLSWTLSRKLLDYLESNAEEYGQVPQFALAEPAAGEDDDDSAGDDDEDDDHAKSQPGRRPEP
jgi:hypothetical protein